MITKPWTIPLKIKRREWGTFFWSHCPKCWRAIRWEPDLCFDCENEGKAKRAQEDKAFDRLDAKHQRAETYHKEMDHSMVAGMKERLFA